MRQHSPAASDWLRKTRRPLSLFKSSDKQKKQKEWREERNTEGWRQHRCDAPLRSSPKALTRICALHRDSYADSRVLRVRGLGDLSDLCCINLYLQLIYDVVSSSLIQMERDIL